MHAILSMYMQGIGSPEIKMRLATCDKVSSVWVASAMDTKAIAGENWRLILLVAV